jgi:hypothetical protein
MKIYRVKLTYKYFDIVHVASDSEEDALKKSAFVLRLSAFRES